MVLETYEEVAGVHPYNFHSLYETTVHSLLNPDGRVSEYRTIYLAMK